MPRWTFLCMKRRKVWDNNYDYFVSLYIALLFIYCSKQCDIFVFLFQINLGIYMQDDKKDFSVLVDRSVGGSSIVDGQIELMLHRYGDIRKSFSITKQSLTKMLQCLSSLLFCLFGIDSLPWQMEKEMRWCQLQL